jgi:hypothetical protein
VTPTQGRRHNVTPTQGRRHKVTPTQGRRHKVTPTQGEPVLIPLVLFSRQAEFLNWLVERYQSRTSAPVEKSSDSGATWMACVFAVWLWLFHPGSIVGFGSRKEILVDRQGDMQSIFEKPRTIIRRLPRYLLPKGFKPDVHLNYMKLLNPAIDTSITSPLACLYYFFAALIGSLTASKVAISVL